MEDINPGTILSYDSICAGSPVIITLQKSKQTIIVSMWNSKDLKYLHLSTSCGNSLQFVVPKTTLKDRLRDRVTHGTKSGPKQYLNNEEEKELAEFLLLLVMDRLELKL